jgi:hypothetical protein
MIEIENISVNNELQEMTVTAVVDNVVLTYEGSYYDPPEYGPALCTATIGIDCVDVNDKVKLQEYLEADAEWEVIDNSDYYDDYSYA